LRLDCMRVGNMMSIAGHRRFVCHHNNRKCVETGNMQLASLATRFFARKEE